MGVLDDRPRIFSDEPEEPKPAPRKLGKRWAMVVAVVLALVLVGMGLGVYQVFLVHPPPRPSFTTMTNELHVVVDGSASRAPAGLISSYSWDWGDGSTTAAPRITAHDYGQEGSYAITLTVQDNRGGKNTTTRQVSLVATPVADFVPRTERMTVSLDASNSNVPGGAATIDSYSWDFGDGRVGQGKVVTHTYATEGRYTVHLEVKDSRGRTAEASRLVSPASTTVDILLDDFFTAECPYAKYWSPRVPTYGDQLLRNSGTCTDFYPWVLFTKSEGFQKQNPSWIYTTYHLDARVRNHKGYDLVDPVVLPVFSTSITPAANSFIHYDMTFNYLSVADIKALNKTPYALDPGYDDGYGYMFEGNITMDFTMTKRVFGVPGSATPDEAQKWWYRNVTFGSPEGPLEKKLDGWFSKSGGPNNKYDIQSGYEYTVQNDYTDLNATVDPTTGQTRIGIHWTGWGLDALFIRFWYWGKASYYDAVNSPYGTVMPQGWMPMEVCWCEQSTLNFTITDHLDLDYHTVSTYHFQAWSNWGPDGIPATDDDQAAWVWAPYLLDYVPKKGSGSPGDEGYPNSELTWWAGQRVRWGSPGSYAYGQPYEIINAPTRMIFNNGSNFNFVFPRSDVPWYDPVLSKWNWRPSHKYGDYSVFMSNMVLRQVCVSVDDPSTCSSASKGDYYLWDAQSKTLSMAGPYQWSDDLPLQPAPWIELGPETLGSGNPGGS